MTPMDNAFFAVKRFLALFSHAVFLYCGVLAGAESDGALVRQAQDLPYEEQHVPQAQSLTKQEDMELQKIDYLVSDSARELSGFQRSDSQSIIEIINLFGAKKKSRLYGSLYEYHRNDNFDARNFFDPVGQKLPEYKRNQFGGTLGISLSDQLTMFASYDGLRINKGSTVLSHIPTPQMKNGDFSGLQKQLVNPWTGAGFQGNIIPESMFSPVSMKLLETIPNPNRNDPVRNFANNLPQVQNMDSIEVRADYELGDNSKVFAEYAISDANEIAVKSLPSFGLNSRGRDQNLSIEFVRNFSPQLVLSIDAGYDRAADTILSVQAGKKGLLALLGIAGVGTLDDLDEGYPDFDISGYTGLGSGQSPRIAFNNVFELSGKLGYIRRSHSMAFEARTEEGQINNDRTGGTRRGHFGMDGSFTGDGFADFLLGLPAFAERGVGSDRADLRKNEYAFSFTDDWKLSGKLSLTFGLAWNYSPFAHSVHDNVYTFVPLRFEPVVDGKIVRIGSKEADLLGLRGIESGHAVFPNRGDGAPTVGFAWSPLGNNRLAIRASFRLYQSPRSMSSSIPALGRSYPVYYKERAQAPEGKPMLTLSNPFEAIPVEVEISAADPRLRNTEFQNWELSIENEILPQWNIEFSYFGSRTHHYQSFLVGNVPQPGPGPIQERRPNPNFGRFNIMTDGRGASSNTLRASLQKRLSMDFSADAFYKFDRSFSDLGAGDPSNPRDLKSERAPKSTPVHEFNLSFIYDLPIGPGRAIPLEWAGRLRGLVEGWRISGIASYQSGFLFNPMLPGDYNNDGVRADRPDQINPGTVEKSHRSIDRWFATEAFVFPAQFRFGNSGRNILVGPGTRNWDISFVKRTHGGRDGDIFELRIQLFNAFNHTNFSIPNATVGTSSFGRIFGAGRSREIEIAVKYSF
jgi:hypothetical protein